MAKRAHRFQFIKPRLTGRSLRGLGDDTITMAGQCADPAQWAANATCQFLFPDGASTVPAQVGCVSPDATAEQAKIDNLAANWNPTGNYTPADLKTIVMRVQAMAANVQTAVNTYRIMISDSTFLDNVANQFIAIDQQVANYSVGWAPGQTQLVAAPNLKNWVISVMTTMMQSMQALALAACSDNSVWATFSGYLSDLWSAALAIGGAVVGAGQAVLHTVEAGIGFAAWLIKWGPYLAGGAILVGGGIYFWRWNKESRTFPSLLPHSSAPVHGW